MGVFSQQEVPRTAVTEYIERLCNYEEEDWYQIQQLAEVIMIQQTGPREAVHAIRKRLKHGNDQQQLMALSILKLLIENSGKRFSQALLASEKIKERFHVIIHSPGENPAVRKALVELLGAWTEKYKNEPGMKSMHDLYLEGRAKLGDRVRKPVETRPRGTSSPAKVEPAPAPRPKTPPPVVETPPAPPANRIDSPPKNKRQSMPPPDKKKVTKSKTAPPAQQQQGRFDFAKEKPKVIQEIAMANQNANNLVNALKLIRTKEVGYEVVKTDDNVQELFARVIESRKKIVRYTRLVEDESWIGTLLATNEELLKACDAYDNMAHGIDPNAVGDYDSDDYVDTSTMASQQSRQSYRSPPRPPPPKLPSRNSPPSTSSSLSPTSSAAWAPIKPQRSTAAQPVHYSSMGDEPLEQDEARPSPPRDPYDDLINFEQMSVSGKTYGSNKGWTPEIGGFQVPVGSEEQDPFADPFADPPERGERMGEGVV